MSTGTVIFALFFFTLVGFLIHASYNKKQTEKLDREGKNPYEIPKVYQRYTDPKQTRHHI